MHNIGNINVRVASSPEHLGDILKVGDGLEVVRTLFFAECAIEIGSYADMKSITRKLTNMIHMIDDDLQTAIHFFWRRHTTYPVGNHHPCIQHSSNYCAA